MGQPDTGTAQLSASAQSIWAKSNRADSSWLPLWCHLLDAAAVAGRLWDDWLPASVRARISEPLPRGEADGRALTLWLAGLHDIGKATPAFAVQVTDLADRMRWHGLATYADPDRRVASHGIAGQILLEGWLEADHDWARSAAQQLGVVVGGHHGVPPDHGALLEARRRRSLLGLADHQMSWQKAQRELLVWSAVEHGVIDRLSAWKEVLLPQPAQVLLTAVVIVADWIASNEELFPYDYEQMSRAERLVRAWSGLELPPRWRASSGSALSADLFAQRFSLPAPASPRPVQVTAVELAQSIPDPGLMVIEAPMGDGKTEAALAAAEVLAARTGAGGCFIALPTRATSDAMFTRVLAWLEHLPNHDGESGARTVMLAHGKARLNEDFQSLVRRGQSSDVAVDGPSADLMAHQWLSGRKKSMLSSFVVGTIDQLLFAALRARHLVLRHLGLAGKVVIIDEAHAYDVYMGQYLDRALEWLGAYHVPTIILSATLPSERRAAMVAAYTAGHQGNAIGPRRRLWREPTPMATQQPDPWNARAGYPMVMASTAAGGTIIKVTEPSGRDVRVSMGRIDDNLQSLSAVLRTELVGGGCALVVRNTVGRVQATARHLREAMAALDIPVSVAHSRFLAPDRAANDQWLRDTFGPPSRDGAANGDRPGAHIVVASQVAEQSLDIDFDLLVTDLAPVDLILQRMGRLHRHPRGHAESGRPERLQRAQCLVAGVNWTASPPVPVTGSKLVYGEHALLRSVAVLTPFLDGKPLILPTHIAPLVQRAYADVPVGPAKWQPAMQHARSEHERHQAEKRMRAGTFRLERVRAAGSPIIGWLDAGVGDIDDGREGRAQVRDTSSETVEVLALVRKVDGTLVVPPWIKEHGGTEVRADRMPPSTLARTIATCSLGFPFQLCTNAVIDELRQQNGIDAWQDSPWLAGQPLLVFDADGEAQVGGSNLHYDPWIGLEVTRHG